MAIIVLGLCLSIPGNGNASTGQIVCYLHKTLDVNDEKPIAAVHFRSEDA